MPIDKDTNYLVRAMVSFEDLSCFVPGIQIKYPSGDDACSAHLINHGVTVEGSSATIEFGAVGSVDFFECQHIGAGARTPCKFTDAVR